MLSLLWQISDIIGLISVVANVQILKKIRPSVWRRIRFSWLTYPSRIDANEEGDGGVDDEGAEPEAVVVALHQVDQD